MRSPTEHEMHDIARGGFSLTGPHGRASRINGAPRCFCPSPRSAIHGLLHDRSLASAAAVVVCALLLPTPAACRWDREPEPVCGHPPVIDATRKRLWDAGGLACLLLSFRWRVVGMDMICSADRRLWMDLPRVARRVGAGRARHSSAYYVACQRRWASTDGACAMSQVVGQWRG